jgi:hypothetical protein
VIDEQPLTSFWIEFDEWPTPERFERIPPFPRSCGVTAASLDEALDLVHRGFYEDRALPPVAGVTQPVMVAPGLWAGGAQIPRPSGKVGIWYPPPLFPERTVVDSPPDPPPFGPVAFSAIDRAGVGPGLTKHRAVVVERLARAAGSTNWYLIELPDQLDQLSRRVAPGSTISFFFDERIAEADLDHGSRTAILEIAQEDGDAVVAYRTHGIELVADYIGGLGDLDGFAADLPPGSRIFFGRFPAAENDGASAITIDLPDLDGIVRSHPH